jgi:hypothetical protein
MTFFFKGYVINFDLKLRCWKAVKGSDTILGETMSELQLRINQAVSEA